MTFNSQLDVFSIPKRSGIYFFYLPNWKMGYVGRTNNLRRRYHDHILIGSHRKEITNYLKEYDNLEFLILEFTDNYKVKDQAIIEKHWIEHYKTKNIKLLNKTDPTLENAYKDSIPILQYTLDGKFVAEHQGVNEAARSVGAKGGGNLVGVLKGHKPPGKRNCNISRHGYLWFYKKNFTKDALLKKLEELKHYKKLLESGTANKSILQFSLNGDYINTFKSIMLAASETKTSYSNISQCAKGYIKQANGFLWIYEVDSSKELLEKKIEATYIYGGEKLIQIDKDTGEIIKYWRSAQEAAKHFKCTREAIRLAARQPFRSAKGFKWKYEKIEG